MAKKIYCDGCGKDISSLTPNEYEWKATVENGGMTKSAGTYDLCTGCGSHLCCEAKPTSWVRCAPEKAA